MTKKSRDRTRFIAGGRSCANDQHLLPLASSYTVHPALRSEERLDLPLITPPLLLRIPPACHPLLSSRVLHSIHSSYSSWTAVTLGTRRHEPTNDNQLETPPSLLQPRRRHKEHDDWSYHAPSIIRLETSGTTPSLRTVTTTRSAHHSSTSAFGKSKIA